ncbi:MAG: 4-hydroxy-tetrahydrodipicolinate reductase [Holosporaceae bacterium]|jgi:4-hydroxy-tetrahydrodipicolinate reductase|nr:4-hydroxy-tetrahydrodipicolinate reductase [Holosporaceae bacterium]
MKIGIIGITGRIGKILAAMIPNEEYSGGTCSKTPPQELVKIIGRSNVLIDFSTPSSTMEAITLAAEHKIPIVSGTTDLSENDFRQIKKLSQIIPILHASNFSLGIQLMAILVKKCSRLLSDFDFSIIDRHHRYKKDSPSGTALFLAQQTSKKAQIVSLREGNIFGEHICDFVGENEMLSLTHRVFNREVFAYGAIKCAKWIVKKEPKLYSMQDYLEAAIHEQN